MTLYRLHIDGDRAVIEYMAMGRSKGGIEASYDATPFDEAPEAGAGSGADAALGSEEPASV